MQSVIIVLFALLISAQGGQGDCLVASKSERQPVYVVNNTGKYELLIPKITGIHLQQGGEIILLCAGYLNRLNQSNANVTTAICVGRDKFLVSNQIYKFPDLECRRSVRANVMHTDEICANGFVSYIGFFIEDQFLKLIEICYESQQAHTIYTTHTLLMTDLKGFQAIYPKPTFNTKGLSPENKSISLVYHIAAQKARLSSLLQSSILASNYITNTSYFTRGHLAPDGDFALPSWKYSTYFFLNACPQWYIINEGNWKHAEAMVRKLRNSIDENLQIITGTYDVLELNDRVGNSKPLFLSQLRKKFPVPKYIWKVVYSEKSKKAVVLVVYNNPHDPVPNYLCSCVCKAYGWYSAKWLNSRKGFIQCCSYTQFKQFVRNVPNLSVTGVLHGPECKFKNYDIYKYVSYFVYLYNRFLVFFILVNMELACRK